MKAPETSLANILLVINAGAAGAAQRRSFYRVIEEVLRMGEDDFHMFVRQGRISIALYYRFDQADIRSLGDLLTNLQDAFDGFVVIQEHGAISAETLASSMTGFKGSVVFVEGKLVSEYVVYLEQGIRLATARALSGSSDKIGVVKVDGGLG